MKYKRGYYDVFVQTCAKNPSKTAIKYFKNGLYKDFTYSELYGVCEYIAQNLQQIKCKKGVIGIVSERNIIIPSVIAAVHKCCTTFMFLNPLQCMESLLQEIHLTVVITIKENESNAVPIELNERASKTVSVFNFEIGFYNLEPLNDHSHLEEYSFIAMTSGSTGKPKHIQVPIQCIQPNIDDFTNLFEISANDIIYFSTPLTFDPSMIEILLALGNGACLLLAPEKPNILFPNDRKNSITFWQTTPSKFFQHSNDDMKNIILSANSTLKILALGGEPLNGIRRLKELKDRDNKTKIFTLYGVTEMSCWACAAELDLNKVQKDRDIPLGKCLSETQINVEPGYKSDVGKIILASGSRKCLILSKSKASDDSNTLNAIDTGDLGEIKNGTIYYRGRKDDIVKRFGIKINLQFIETMVMQCPRVKACSCVWLPKPMLLVIYYSSETLRSCELSEFLKCKLDDKHWPDNIVRVDNIPMNSHGKVSKHIVSELYKTFTNSSNSFDCLKDCFLKELQLLMNRTFTYKDIKNKDFFSLGGTSFLAMAMCNKISLTCPEFGKYILPLLITQKNTIDEIMQLACKEIFVDKVKSKRMLKRPRSGATSITENRMKMKNELSSISSMKFSVTWTFDTGKCIDASPTIIHIGVKPYCIVGSHSGKIVVTDAKTGALEGMIAIKSRIEASVFCYYDDLLPYGVVGAYDGTVVCFAIKNCQEIWRINVNAMIKSKATCCKGLLYIASYDGKMRCIDVKNGCVKHVIHVADQAISADLALAADKFVLVGALSGECVGVRAASKSVAWRASVASPIFASPVVYDSDKYVLFAEVKGEVHCLAVENGVLIWKYDGALGNIFSSIYVKAIDSVTWQMAFGCHDNNVYSLKINNNLPKLWWKARLPSPIYATPCGLNEETILAASTNGMLSVMNAVDGSILADYQLPGETFSSPLVYEDQILIGCRNDLLYSVKYVVTKYADQ